MSAEEAKLIRRTAKGRFTRKRNELLKSIADKSNREIVENNYAHLVEAWGLLESKHDLYAMYLTDEEVEAADSWITETQEFFTEATTMKISYINDIVMTEYRACAEAEHEEVRNKKRKQIQRIIDQAAIRRGTAQVVFETSCQSIINVLKSDFECFVVHCHLPSVSNTSSSQFQFI